MSDLPIDVIVARPLDLRRTGYNLNPGATSMLSFEGMSGTAAGLGVDIVRSLDKAKIPTQLAIALVEGSLLRQATLDEFPHAAVLEAELRAPRLIVVDSPSAAPRSYTKPLDNPTAAEQQELRAYVDNLVGDDRVVVFEVPASDEDSQAFRAELVAAHEGTSIVLLGRTEDPAEVVVGAAAASTVFVGQVESFDVDAVVETATEWAKSGAASLWMVSDGRLLWVDEQGVLCGHAGSGHIQVPVGLLLASAGLAAGLGDNPADRRRAFEVALRAIARRRVLPGDPDGRGYVVNEGKN